MAGLLCPGGRAHLSTGHKDSRLQCWSDRRWGAFPLPRPTYQPCADAPIAPPVPLNPSLSLHALLSIRLSLRSLIAAAFVSTGHLDSRRQQCSFHSRYGRPTPPSSPSPFALGLCAWAVKQSRSTTCVYCVLCCAHRLCQKTLPPASRPSPREHTEKGRKGLPAPPRHMLLIWIIATVKNRRRQHKPGLNKY